MAGKAITSNQLVENQLAAHLLELEKVAKADCLVYVGPLAYGADDDIRDALEAIDNKREKLIFMLQTSGGYAETARRISDTTRHHYKVVDFLVPNSAMSAGTILVMSGDAIYMDYHAVLGPIDPQIEGPDGKLLPALGYVLRYEELLKKAKRGKISQAEMEILLSFDQGELYSYEQSRDLSRALLQEWLVKYKFKDWKVTETRQIPVTPAMKRKRAKEIAKQLNDVKLWRSHGLGINMERLRTILNLKIDDFGSDRSLNAAVRPFHKLFVDYMGRRRYLSALQTRVDYQPLMIGPLMMVSQ
ncbi:MAG: serine dehydrogenasease [Alphaproteobacteria bacterium]